MRKAFYRAGLALAIAGASLGAAAAGHYVAGVEGTQAATVPPPGIYYLGYLVDYNLNELRAPGSSASLPGSNTGTVLALANRVTWVTQYKFLGADYGVEAVVPLQRASLSFGAAGLSDTRSGIGGVYLSPVLLGWHGASWDAVLSAGFWADTGPSTSPAGPGKGFNSTMFTAGGTYYFDQKRSWNLSALMRYEINTRNPAGLTPGNQISLEWGLGKGLGPVQLGLVGYDVWQVTDDSGAGAGSARSSRHAIGAEVVYPLMNVGVILKAAAYKEYAARAGTGPEPKGSLVRFTFVKAF